MTNPVKSPVLKHFSGFEIKDEARGEIEAVVATLEVVDRDGDIIRKGAIGKGAKVKLSAWGHDAVWGARPVGKGTLREEGDQLKFDGRVFLTTADGRETFEVLKEMGPDQEWSFGFRVLGSEVPDEDDRKQGAFRILTKLDAFEVSPVLLGAGIDTQTTSIKAADPDPAAADAEAKSQADREDAERLEAEAKAVQAAAELKERERIQAEAQDVFDRFQRTMRRIA